MSQIPIETIDYGTNVSTSGSDRTKKNNTHWSQWFILLNTNKHHKLDLDHANKLAAEAKEALSFVVQKFPQKIFTTRNGDPINNSTITKIRLRQAAEIGPKFSRVHTHSDLTVIHKTLLQLDVKELRRLLFEYFEEHGSELANGFFLNVKFVRNADAALMLYMEKEQNLNKQVG